MLMLLTKKLNKKATLLQLNCNYYRLSVGEQQQKIIIKILIMLNGVKNFAGDH
jgi:hypothetical protein